MKLELSLRPVFPRAKGALRWRLMQEGGGSPGSEGTRPEMVRLMKGTIEGRVAEGHTIVARTYTAAGQLEEHAEYKQGSSRFLAVPKPEGEEGFGRKCRTLNEDDETKKKRLAATKAPKAEKPAKPPKVKRMPPPPKEPKVKTPKAVKPPKPPKEPKVNAPKPAKPPKAAPAPKVKAPKPAPPAANSAGEKGFDAFLDSIMADPSILASG